MWTSGYYGYLADYLIWCALTVSVWIHAWFLLKAWPADRKPRARLIAGNFAVGVCLLVSFAFAAESYLRFVSVSTDVMGATMTCKRWKAAYTSLNSLYCRDTEWEQQKPPGTYRIAFVGDSFVYGWGINRVEDRFPDLIQARFDSTRQTRVEVMNVAWGGWDTEEQLKAIREYLGPYSVDEIVLCYLPNDIHNLIPVTDDFHPKRAPKSVYLNTESSFLLDWVFYRVIAPRFFETRAYGDRIAEAYADGEIWTRQMRLLRQIIEVCRERGTRLRVALLPFIVINGESYDPRRIHRQLADFFAKNSIPVVDLRGAVADHPPGSLILSRQDPNPNEKANRLFADGIWDAFYAAQPGGLP